MIRTRQILGIRFLDGTVDEAIDSMWQTGGVLIAPSGTCFARLRNDVPYREAVMSADLAIPDSGAMVLLWKLFRGDRLTRISGLKYILRLSDRLFAQGQRRVLWVLPNEQAREKTAAWLNRNGFAFSAQSLYVAPRYAPVVDDARLVELIEEQKPDDVVVGIGSGPQEKLGPYLRDHLSYRPAIHCIGGALGFVTGDQVAIPDWADRFYLGWLFRLFSQPRIFIPRLSKAIVLPWLLFRYGSEMPALKVP
jgi:exopolysaccharide biosynthesis WecB/TagA/CpsF family protein